MSLDTLKALPHYLLPKQALTSFAGFMANIKTPWIKNYLISQFVAKYDVNMLEACEENPLNYACFNDFFIRHLKAERRPIADAGIVSPVDGCISEIGNITQGQILQAKGRYYTVNDFLACDSALCEQFINGRFATLYLSPKDYHRIHMPIEGTLRNMIYVPGKLFSVAPATVGAIPQLFARNERLVVFFDTPVGLMAMVLVGATIVGSISTTWHGEIARSKNKTPFDYTDTAPRTLVQGAEMGYFKLGSTVVLLFANNHSIEWQRPKRRGHNSIWPSTRSN
jgi:phosphatidylserine decarboxylase